MNEYILGRSVVMADVACSNLTLGSKTAIAATYDNNAVLTMAVEDQQKVIDFLMKQISLAIEAKAHARKQILTKARAAIMIREA